MLLWQWVLVSLPRLYLLVGKVFLPRLLNLPFHNGLISARGELICCIAQRDDCET